ncbi:hypothetical protein ACWDTT_30210 [Streptosporangium sandarakinum]|uniref:hypothetical protein n=1 Tax=Streptosporangium sandarakinum TaxID=1260955 RepID=UPI00379605BD
MICLLRGGEQRDQDPLPRYGIDADQYGDALAEARPTGRASEEEIREAVPSVHVDAALPDDGVVGTLPGQGRAFSHG